MDSTFVLGVVGSDVHCVANQLLERDLVFRNQQVVNLGVALSLQEVVEALTQINNPILLLGTLNGDLNPTVETISSLREKFSEFFPIIVGGNYVLGEGGKDRTLDLLEAGASLVIKNCPSIEEAVAKILEFSSDYRSLLRHGS